MEAGPAADRTIIQDWHFNILGVDVRAVDSTIKAAYKKQVLLEHPDRNHTSVNALVKMQMLNEAKNVLLQKQKRLVYETAWTNSVVKGQDIRKGDIVKTSHHEDNYFNFRYARVVSDNIGSIFEPKFTVKTQHARHQYEIDNDETSVLLNFSWKMLHRETLMRVYGDPERVVAEQRWSTYYAKYDKVMIQNVKEAPWFNGMAGTIIKYSSNLMRFIVQVGVDELAFMPHNIFPTMMSVQGAPVGAGGPGAACAAPPSALEYSVGQSVEVMWQNLVSDNAGKARKVTWHVGVITAINKEGSEVSSYDVQMSKSFAKEPGAIILKVSPKKIQPKRKRGKRAAPEA